MQISARAALKGIDGRAVIVTGAARGIGAGVARAFARAGARVLATDVLEDEGRALAAALACGFRRADLASDADLDALVADAARTLGGIDFVVCVACSYADPGADADRRAWRQGFDVNLFGHVMLVQRARPHLSRSPCASVVNFSSGSAHFALPGRWIYPASKAAIEQVTRSQAVDLAADGIRVNAVLPAWTEKEWLREAPAEVRERYEGYGERLHMARRAGRVDEVADAVLFLCSAHAGFLTGACLRVDGGHTGMGPQGHARLPGAVAAMTQGD